MLNIAFEITQLQGAFKKQQNEIKALQDSLQKLLNSKVKISSVVKSQQKEFDRLAKENERLRDKISQKIKKKELSCMQEVEFTEENIAKVREMAICMTKEQIARRFNMSLTSYIKREEKIPALKEAYNVGCATFMAEVSSKFVENIRSGCKASLFYYMNNKMRMRNDTSEETQITISQEFLDKPLKIVSGSGNYEKELMENYHKKIMSITVTKTKENDEGELEYSDIDE